MEEVARRPRGRPRRLTRVQVARAALEIADRDGIDALGMQRLAAELGVGTMTLYGYVKDKGDLFDAVVDAAVADAGPPPTGDDWRESVTALALFVHRVLDRHPSVAAIRFRQPVLRPEALQFGDQAMGALLDAGFPPDEAAAAFRLLFTYVVGYAGLSPAAQTETARHEAAVALANLSPETHPVLSRHVESAARAMGGEVVFEWGLETILDGLEARLTSR